ncbi:hypothetical protein GCM10009676_40990 [Prauserella halophila]|uniref:Uncharacterized protein n=1 Tax=Prauserella halophila TaxID=185641 RepID=A0ABP4H8R3_9PSEU|nr:DUF3558 domain-containing protein [Prauserella halophila]MCP2236743.1 Protein of unknown function (DUF3558) [Prauserella halophila]
MAAAATGALLVLAAGCSDDTTGQAQPSPEPSAPASDSTTAAPSTSASAQEPPHSGAPAVTNPLPESVLSAEPCDVVTPEQVTELLGKPVEGTEADLDELGEGCEWQNPQRMSGFDLQYNTVMRQGLSAAYANVPSQMEHFEETGPIQGFPAVEYNNGEEENLCTVVVGLADEYNVSTNVTLGQDAEDQDSCEAANQVADIIVGNLKDNAGGVTAMGKLFGIGNPEDRSLQDEQDRIQFENSIPFFNDSPTIQEIVTRVKAGESAKWQNASNGTDRVMAGHEEAVDLAKGAAQALESSWSGAGADAASEKIKIGSDAAAKTSDVYRQNRQHYDENISAFDALKAKLPENLPAQEPELSAWDSVTPWDTDQEDKANQYKAQVQQAQSQYSTHQSSSLDSSMAVEGNFGQLQEFDGKLGDIFQGGDADGPTDSGVIDIPDPDSGGGDGGGPVATGDPAGGRPVGGDPVGDRPVGGGYQSPDRPGDVPAPSYASPDDSTGTAGYTPPSTAMPPAANYPGSSYPGSGGFGPGGPGAATPGTGGAGPIGTTGFGPTGGGTSGYGGSAGGAGGSSGGAAGGSGGAGGGARAGSPGAGRMTGAAPGGFGPTGSGGAGTGAGSGAAGSGGAGARGGMGAMGGAGKGGGQGSEDEEHQRKYVADTDEAFDLTEGDEVLRDPRTGFVATPPTIGE